MTDDKWCHLVLGGRGIWEPRGEGSINAKLLDAKEIKLTRWSKDYLLPSVTGL